jgi:uncharacterized C2H2 Zn-finger protein
MSTLPFAIGEWLACPRCDCICDALFHPAGSDVDEPELVLGGVLPSGIAVTEHEWHIEVAAKCPKCGVELRAEAVFNGRVLKAFRPI